jgi:lysine-arginine-ornithine-binding protein
MSAPRAAIGILISLLLLTVAARGETVRIGTEADDAPFESVGPDGKPAGFDIDLGNAICARAKLTCQWVNMDFDGLVAALDAHRIDAAMSQISVTPDRAKRVLFTEPVSRTAGVLVATIGSGVTDDPRTLKGKTVGVQSGTTHETYAKMTYGPVGTVQVYQTQLQAFQDLLAGRIDATLCDQGAAFKWLEAHAGTFGMAGKPISDPAVFGTGTAIAVRLGDAALRKKLDDGLASVLGDGTYAGINARYFPFSIAPAGVSVHP